MSETLIDAPMRRVSTVPLSTGLTTGRCGTCITNSTRIIPEPGMTITGGPATGTETATGITTDTGTSTDTKTGTDTATATTTDTATDCFTSCWERGPTKSSLKRE